MKLLFLLALAALGVFGAHRFMEQRFCFEHICLPGDAQAPNSIVADEDFLKLETVFGQSFTYLDRGKQSFAFISQDGRYVLKFFDFNRIDRRAAEVAANESERSVIRHKRLTQLIHGYDVAYRLEKEQSGLVYVQLEPNPELPFQASVIDSLGARHRISVAKVPFVVQRLAVPSRLMIAALLDKGDVDAAKTLFGQLVSMYESGYRRGIVDDDHNIMYNTGFVNGAPIRIDVGRLKWDESYLDTSVSKKDLDKLIHERVGGWLQRHYPEYRQEIIDFL